MLFRDRKEAGRELASLLSSYHGRQDAIVLALPRGGVPVAFEIATALRLPLDLMLVRKLGVPGQEELAMGAIANGDIEVLNEEVIHGLTISRSMIADVVAEERKEMERRKEAYRGDKPAPDLRGRTVILVDDGMATGANMRAAVMAARKQGSARIVIAVPLASDSAVDMLKEAVDEIVCPYVPKFFYGVGRFYLDFSQTSDSEVRTLLKQAEIEESAQDGREKRHAHEHT